VSDDPFVRVIEDLLDFYLALGCPCRFPRFRATVARSTQKVAGGSFTSEDQRRLIYIYERKVELVGKEPLEGWGGPVEKDMYQAKCGACRSRVQRSSNEFANGGWVDYLSIALTPGVMELGAFVGHPLYRARPWISPGPGMAGIHKASEAFPLVDEEKWLLWMRELATPSTTSASPG
jgi:hypothetical protein